MSNANIIQTGLFIDIFSDRRAALLKALYNFKIAHKRGTKITQMVYALQ